MTVRGLLHVLMLNVLKAGGMMNETRWIGDGLFFFHSIPENL